ncbi:MAG: hypothetical protein HQ483_08170 [Rhodospirillales bacterium]|nr:hypothetical protein [Rhodospirillales bacterium]
MPEAPPVVLHAISAPEELTEVLGEDGIMRSDLSYEHFAGLVGSHLEVIGSNNATALLEVVEGAEKPRSSYPGQKRMPFHLILHGPETVVLNGHHFGLRHPQLGVIPYVLLTRTIAYPDQPPGAYYQVIFC